MISLTTAHAIARNNVRWNPQPYKEALADAMRKLWAEFKKSVTTPEQAIEQLSERDLENEIYLGYRVDGYSTTEAGYLARDMARFAKENRWLHIAIEKLKKAGFGSALTE